MKYTFSICFLALSLFCATAYGQVQKINTIAGNGSAAFSGDGHSAVGASLFGPIAVAVDSAENVYVVDYYNNRVRRVSAATGIITTVAGNGVLGNNGDNSYGASAEICPSGIAVDKNGNVFISDGASGVVRKLNMATGIITRVAGNNTWGYSGDGAAATDAALRANRGLAFDNNGNMFIADAGNHVVRMVDTFGIISTVAGNDTSGFSGDGGAATAARLDSPYAVAADGFGRLYITDYKNNVIRRVDTGNIITYAGNNALLPGFTGSNIPATDAQLNYPQGIAVDPNGNLFIADANNNVIRKVDTFGVITTVVGNGSLGFGGDLGYVTGANLFNPYGVAVDYKGHIYIADANNERVRKTYLATEGVANVAAPAAISASPNPFNNEVTISGLAKGDKVCIYDVAGRQVSGLIAMTAAGTHTFTINGLAAGVYMAVVSNGDGGKKATIQLVKE